MSTKIKLAESYAHAFREGIQGPSSRREAILIREGWGSSGYYPAEVLGRDMPKVFGPGTHMYMNHPTNKEDWERPERDVRDLVGTLVESPRMAGIDCVSGVNVYSHWQPFIEEVGPDIGLSMRSFGFTESGVAGGKDGPIVQEIVEGISIDYVTTPGAGGKLLPLIESARGAAPSPEQRALEAYNKIMESAGKPPIPKELFESIMSRGGDTLELFEEAERIGDRDEWNWSGELREAEQTFDYFLERDVSTAERIALAKKGQAIPIKDGSGNITGGRFPMANCEDVKAASMSVGRTSMPDIKSFIKRVAGKLSCPVPFKESAAPAVLPKESQMGLEQDLSELKESFGSFKTKTEGEISELKEAKENAERRAERAEEAVLRESAAKVVAGVVNENEGLPPKAKARIVEAAMSRDLPVLQDGKLDESVLQERARAAMSDEVEYLNGVSGVGTPRGVGLSESSRSNGGGSLFGDEGVSEDDVKELTEAFERTGMSKEAAARAAEGR